MGIAPSCADGTSTKKILVNCKKNVKWKIGEGTIYEKLEVRKRLQRFY